MGGFEILQAIAGTPVCPRVVFVDKVVEMAINKERRVGHGPLSTSETFGVSWSSSASDPVDSPALSSTPSTKIIKFSSLEVTTISCASTLV